MSTIPDSQPKTLPMADIAHATDQSRMEAAEDVRDAEPSCPNGMSEILDWAWTTGIMPPPQRLTLLTISRHAGEAGKCDPSQSTIAELVGVARQTVSRHVQFLARIGELIVTPIITDQGLRYEYVLAGALNNWAPTPKDPNQKPTVQGALTARVDKLNATVAALEDELARFRGLGHAKEWDNSVEDAETPDTGLLESQIQSVVLTAENAPEVIRDGDSTPTTCMGGVTNGAYNSPDDSQRQEISDAVFCHWGRIGRSEKNPGGWQSPRVAIAWYGRHYNSAPPGNGSFLEQKREWVREAEMEAQAERQRRAEDEVSGEAQVTTFDPQAEAVWGEVQVEIAKQVPKPTYETWFKRTRGVSVDAEVFVVGAPTSFAVEWLEQRQYHAVQTIVEEVTGQPLEIQFIVFGGATPGEDLEQNGEEAEVAPNCAGNNEPGTEV